MFDISSFEAIDSTHDARIFVVYVNWDYAKW